MALPLLIFFLVLMPTEAAPYIPGSDLDSFLNGLVDKLHRLGEVAGDLSTGDLRKMLSPSLTDETARTCKSQIGVVAGNFCQCLHMSDVVQSAPQQCFCVVLFFSKEAATLCKAASLTDSAVSAATVLRRPSTLLLPGIVALLLLAPL